MAALIAAEPAYASCASGTIYTAVTEPCVLGGNKTLVATEEGSITVNSGAAVTVDHVMAGGNRLYNSGSLGGDLTNHGQWNPKPYPIPRLRRMADPHLIRSAALRALPQKS
ncbi:hypothetical protein [Pseudomonas sp. Marseille-Q5115]|uniref:hypothetical protein n=1 Tax=Pseudomonas sp. Marseille-Q5115 TaxID=2866593 RepID=UPI001CE4925E|nr:hypothetical protein [Pseudomonas sp. Marseille-Q5115]